MQILLINIVAFSAKYAYLNFFFSKILVENKKVANIQYQPVIDVLNKANLGILATNRLPAPENSISPGYDAIFAAFENVGYIGELRQRWTEIKKLLRGGSPAVIPASMRARV